MSHIPTHRNPQRAPAQCIFKHHLRHALLHLLLFMSPVGATNRVRRRSPRPLRHRTCRPASALSKSDTERHQGESPPRAAHRGLPQWAPLGFPGHTCGLTPLPLRSVREKDATAVALAQSLEWGLPTLEGKGERHSTRLTIP